MCDNFGMKSKNLTISLDQELIALGKRYAKLHGTTLNQLFREFIQSKVVGESSSSAADELMEALEEATGSSRGKRWSREDAYER